MSDDIELVRGSGNAFRDFGVANPDLEQGKAILAARIIEILDERGLSLRKAAGPDRVSTRRFFAYSTSRFRALHAR